MKLRVDFAYEDAPSRPAASAAVDHADALRRRLAPGGDAGVSVSADSGDPGVQERLALRKKYDTVVEYTVHLTAVRPLRPTVRPSVRRVV